MTRWIKFFALTLAGLVGLVVVALIIVVVLLQRGYFDPMISRQASNALGREVVLTGPITLGYDQGLSIGLGPLTIGNPDWAQEQGISAPMASVQHAAVSIALWPLLTGRIVLPEIALDRPEGQLVRLADGRNNWQFDKLQSGGNQDQSEQSSTTFPELGEIHIDDGSIDYLDKMSSRNLAGTFSASMTRGVQRYDIKANLGVRDLDGKSAEPQRAQLAGWINNPAAPQDGFELTATSNGENAGPLLALAGVATKGRLPGYDATVTVGRDADAWRLVNLDVSLGDNMIKGNGAVGDPTTLAGLNLDITAVSPKPGALLEMLGLGARPVPAFNLRAIGKTEGERNSLTITGSLGNDRLDIAAGTTGPLAELRELDLNANAKGTELGKLLPLAGLTEKPVPAYALDARAKRRGDKGADIDAALTLGGTTMTAKGSIDDLLHGQGVDLASTAKGQDLAEILDIFGLPKITLPPYKVAGRVGRSGNLLTVNGLDGRVGNSDVQGDVSVNIAAKPAFVKADLQSNRVEFADLAGLVGAPPGAGPKDAASPEQKAAAQKLAAEQRLIPDAKIDAAAWKNLNLDVRFQGKSVIAPKLPIQNLAFHVIAKDGLITLEPFEAVIAGGHINALAAIDGRKTPVAGNLDMRIRSLQLNDFMRRFGFTNDALGVFSGRAQLRGQGADVRQMAATADGRIALTMTGGSVDRLLPELAGIDLGQVLVTYIKRLMGTESENTQIRCAIADLDVQNGMVSTKTVLVDTPSDKLTLQGKINLGNEQMDLMFHAYPRDASIGSMRMPIAIGGPMRNPSVAPAPGYVENRPLGWAMAPLAALVPFIELGSKDDRPCEGVVQ
ncbi:Uncharacterized protein involved in outer membrane biogenesis [Arboricoccus pini]|uniref:Uncharacterized protein involved in outer membrane biogenesis n=1 Tax=Arboricoccus pini TaxID=1963835 RepID=A0A212QN96_9PROT|nr:AsmA family protein [Arboricoccus pini]SNB60718.1 Uncharacterized protein involved in outer membrane biogenesis [Arboricoccus pini]